jgi:hypothetical protein
LSHLILRTIVAVVAPAVAVIAFAVPAAACDRCRLLGTTAYHEPYGGDDHEDGRFAPLDPDQHEQGGIGNFVVQGGKWPQPGGFGTNVTITYSYENLFDGGLKMPGGQPLPATLIRKSIEEALGLWASAAPLTFVEVVDDGLTYNQGSTQFGQIRFRHTYINGPDPPPPALPIAKAQAYFPCCGGLFAGDVEFDNSDRWQEVGTLPVPDILGAAIHELGHSLGLGHTDIAQANMYWIFTRYSGLGTGALHPDDIAGIRAVYGPGSGGVVPLPRPIPEPASVVSLLFAIGWWFVRRPCR